MGNARVRVSHAHLSHGHANATCPTPIRYDEAYITGKLRDARQSLRECQSKAKQLRKSFLEERAEAMAAEGNATKEACYRSIIAAEQSRELFTSLRFMIDKNPVGAIQRLQIPDPTDPACNDAKKCKKWIDVDDPTEMNEILIKANKKQFRLAADTPFGDTRAFSEPRRLTFCILCAALRLTACRMGLLPRTSLRRSP